MDVLNIRNTTWRALRQLLGILLPGLVCVQFSVRALAQTSAVPEYNVKAAFLTAFAQYTTWPAASFPASNSPVIIGVLGADPFGEVLDKTAREQKGARPLEVRRVNTAAAAAACHIVFISKKEGGNEAAWLRTLKEKPVLTVGESGQTVARGGVIEFIIVGGSVRFEASWPAMELAGLKIASPMLASARKVHQPPKAAP